MAIDESAIKKELQKPAKPGNSFKERIERAKGRVTTGIKRAGTFLKEKINDRVEFQKQISEAKKTAYRSEALKQARYEGRMKAKPVANLRVNDNTPQINNNFGLGLGSGGGVGLNIPKENYGVRLNLSPNRSESIRRQKPKTKSSGNTYVFNFGGSPRETRRRISKPQNPRGWF